MDFDALNTKADAERGATLHLLHPQLRHPIYVGDGADAHGRLVDPSSARPATVTLMGAEADAARAAWKKYSRLSEIEQGSPAQIAALLSALIVGFDGITRKVDGKAVDVKPDAAGVAFLLSRSEDFLLQMLDFVKDQRNFFSEGLNA